MFIYVHADVCVLLSSSLKSLHSFLRIKAPFTDIFSVKGAPSLAEYKRLPEEGQGHIALSSVERVLTASQTRTATNNLASFFY